MAGSWVGGVSGTTSATIPTHAVGDLIIARAFRDGNNTAPTIPAGQNWTPIDNSAGSNSNGAAIAYKIATSTSEATGTWTSATRLDVGVWRGFSGIGGSAVDGAASSTVNYPTLTMSVGTGTSWVAGFGAHRSINTTLENPPGTMTNRLTAVTGTDEGAIHDTNGGVASWTGTTVSVGGTSSGWRAHTVELILAATASDGSSSGTATATGVGASTAASVAASAGVATATATATSSAASVGASAGVGAATGVGASSSSSVGASAGTATTSGIGSSSAEAVASSAGSSSVSGISPPSESGIGDAAGAATATAVGASIAAALGTASGTSTVSGVGASVSDDETDTHDGFSPSEAKQLREYLTRRKDKQKPAKVAANQAAPEPEPVEASPVPVVPASPELTIQSSYFTELLDRLELLRLELDAAALVRALEARKALELATQAQAEFQANEAATAILALIAEHEQDEDDEDDLMLLMSI